MKVDKGNVFRFDIADFFADVQNIFGKISRTAFSLSNQN